MTENLLNLAQTRGFVCAKDIQNNWQIFLPHPTENWKLQQVEDKWLVLIAETPQLLFGLEGAKSFLEQFQNCKFSYNSVCKPVEDALHQQAEQERLLNQVTTQIRQSLELPIILKTAVEQLQKLLQVERVVIYQFQKIGVNTQNSPLKIPRRKEETERQKDNYELLGCGRITYEAKADDAILSVLNLMEEEQCFVKIPKVQEKYRKGFILAVEDVETSYAKYKCFLKLLRRAQIRAKLVAPIIVREELWGLLIAHQCNSTRQWREREKNFVGHIAEQLAIALYQAELYAQVQQQNIILEQRVRERTQELHNALLVAQAALQAKTEFIAAINHELRTPLTCVIGMSETILRLAFGEEKNLPPHKQQSYLKTINESGKHLLEIINNILALQEIQSGKAGLDLANFSLITLTQQSIQSFWNKASSQSVKLIIELGNELKESGEQRHSADCFCGDREHLKQILFNLLDNAIKFTPKGGQVTLRVWRELDVAVFQVEDTGIGIPKHHLNLMFQTFQQLEKVYHRTYEGTG